MRTLIVRVTAVAALLAALLAGLVAAVTGAHWTVVALRAGVALLVVAAVGYGFGLILMRTALRRYYDQARAIGNVRRARGNR